MIDVNVSIGAWPFRHLSLTQLDVLIPKLTHHGVHTVWVGHLDGLFHKDVASVNTRLAEACAQAQGCEAKAFATINPVLPQWEEDLRRSDEVHGMKGIRLHPNYHGYALDDARFAAVLEAATARGMVVQLVVCMEDERMMHPLMRVEHVDITPLPGILKVLPDAKVVLLNAFRGVRGVAIDALVETKQVYFDIAWLEGAAGIDRIRKQIPVERLLLGSHSPLFYYESSLLKLGESSLEPGELEAITIGNAKGLLA